MRVRWLIPLVVFGLSISSQAQLWSGVLAPARGIDWTHAGVTGGISSASWTQCGSTIAPYGSSANPQSASPINTALAACGPNTYVQLGAGSFYLSTGIVITQKSHIVLRGSGPTQTEVYFYGHDSCGGLQGAICVKASDTEYSGAPSNVANWTTGYAQGSTSITLGSNVSGSIQPYVGATLILDQLNDGTTRAADTGNIFVCSSAPACTQSNGGNGRSGRNQQQIVKITSVSGSGPYTVGITPSIYMPNWRSSQAPQAWWANVADPAYVGIENMTVDFSNDGGGGGNGIEFFNVENSWVQNCSLVAKVSEPVPSGTYRLVEGYQAHNVTVRDNYLVGRKTWDAYGIDFWEGGDNLIENNIIQSIPTPMMCENCYGNVYTYNFTLNNQWGNPSGTWAQGSVYHHGSFDAYVLTEGNVAYSMELENYFGQAFFYTAFRNRFFGFQVGNENQSVPGFYYGLDRYENVVGNILGTSGYHTNYEMIATGNTSHSGSGSCNNTIFVIGLGSNCADGDNVTWPYNDVAAAGTEMLWGNYDVVNRANRFVKSEDGSGAPGYPALSGPSSALPASFVYNGAPSWWPSGKPWPLIGPDVSGGNLSVCSGGTYDKWPATSSSQCAGGTLASSGINGESYSNPAMDCYLTTMGGPPDGSGPALTNFDANVCYGTPSSAPAPPSGLSAAVQ